MSNAVIERLVLTVADLARRVRHLETLEIAAANLPDHPHTAALGGAISTDQPITVSDLNWIGLGAAKGRIVFDDATIDAIYVIGGWFGIGAPAPKAALHGTGSSILGTGAANVPGADLGAGETNVYLDEVNHRLYFYAKYSDGVTLKLGYVQLA